MSNRGITAIDGAGLRSRAVSRLAGREAADGARAQASAALAVLHELASSPATAPDALALLHELQVHQVELDLQTEELHRSRAELEDELRRQTQLYDFSPSGCLAVDDQTMMRALNLTAARLLGEERDSLVGRRLDAFLTPRASDSLHTLLERAGAGHRGESCTLDLGVASGPFRRVLASACGDPGGSGFLVAFLEAGDR